jgi:drug/metabolite transporter (DMT)-like permease
MGDAFYYLLLVAVCVMSTVRSMANRLYINVSGSSPVSTYRFSALSTFIFSVMMLATMGFRLEISLFSLAVGVFIGLSNVCCIYLAFKVMEEGGISRYTLFLNLGGMVLPFFYGLFFNGDAWTVGKFICLLLLGGALFVNLEKGEKSSLRIKIYSLCIFMLNGLGCVALSFHQSNPLGANAVNGDSFTVLYMLLNTLFGLIILLFLSRKKRDSQPKQSKSTALKSLAYTAVYGLLYGFGNYLLAVCLLHIDPSYQFPIFTGGTVLLAGFAGLPFGEKLTKRFFVSAALVLVGTTALLLPF